VLGQRAPGNAGACDHDVGRAEARDEFAGGASERRGVANIPLESDGPAARKLGDERIEKTAPAREDADIVASARIMPGQRGADAAARAGNEDVQLLLSSCARRAP
jgi:hypothetical protein